MKTSTVKEIISINEWTNPKFWKLTYFYNMKLENWEEISLGKYSKDAFKVWDTVNYEDYTDDKWKLRQKEVRENPKKPEYKQDQRWYFTSIAFQIWFANYKKDEDYQNCVYLSKRIFADMLDNYESKQPEEKPEEKKEDDLPF